MSKNNAEVLPLNCIEVSKPVSPDFVWVLTSVAGDFLPSVTIRAGTRTTMIPFWRMSTEVFGPGPNHCAS
jgi:hypothetical protein